MHSMTCQLRYWVIRLTIQVFCCLSSTLLVSSQSPTLPIHSKVSLHLITILAMHLAHLHLLPLIFPIVTQSVPLFVHSQTQKVGSGTQQVAYCIGYPLTTIVVCTHLLYLQSLVIPMVDLFLFPLTTLLLALLAPTFSIVNIPDPFSLWIQCCNFLDVAYCNSVLGFPPDVT